MTLAVRKAKQVATQGITTTGVPVHNSKVFNATFEECAALTI
jgi:hypothetical protein